MCMDFYLIFSLANFPQVPIIKWTSVKFFHTRFRPKLIFQPNSKSKGKGKRKKKKKYSIHLNARALTLSYGHHASTVHNTADQCKAHGPFPQCEHAPL